MTRKKILIPKFDNEVEGIQTLSYIIWRTPGLYRNAVRDAEYCSTIWKNWPMAEIWYEEFGSNFWGLSYRVHTQGEMGVFGND